MIALRDYQEDISNRAAALLAKYKMAYLAMECRTGKTLTALAAAAKYGATSVLVISKVKALPSIRSDYELLKPSYTLDTINYESAHKVSGKYDLIIIDEAHSLGAYPKPSVRTKNIKKLCKKLPIIYLSGTPSPESFSQLYHQFWVSDFSPFKLYATFYKWAREFVRVVPKMVNGYSIMDYSNANKAKIDRYTKHLFIDYTQEEAGFEANIEETELTVPMSAWTRNAINTIYRDKVLQGKNCVILGDTPAKLMSKMHQLSSGTVIAEDGTTFITDRSKAEFIKSYFHGQKKAIFYCYQAEEVLLKETFPNWTSIPEEFQESTDKIFISQVRRAREGVRLDTADALIFYNLEYSYLSYEQGRNRLSSKERKEPARVYFIKSDCGIEDYILGAVHDKTDFTLSFYSKKLLKRGY